MELIRYTINLVVKNKCSFSMRCGKTQARPPFRVFCLQEFIFQIWQVKVLTSEYITGTAEDDLCPEPAVTQTTPKVASDSLHSETGPVSACSAPATASLSSFRSILLSYSLLSSPFWLIQVFNVHISSLSPSLILESGDHITAVGLAYYIKNNNKEHKKDQVKRIAQ